MAIEKFLGQIINNYFLALLYFRYETFRGAVRGTVRYDSLVSREDMWSRHTTWKVITSR